MNDDDWFVEDTVPREQLINPAFVSSSDDSDDEATFERLSASPNTRGAHRGRLSPHLFAPRKLTSNSSSPTTATSNDEALAEDDQLQSDFSPQGHLRSSLGLAAEDYFPSEESHSATSENDNADVEADFEIPPALDASALQLPDLEELRAKGLLDGPGKVREDDELTVYPEEERETNSSHSESGSLRNIVQLQGGDDERSNNSSQRSVNSKQSPRVAPALVPPHLSAESLESLNHATNASPHRQPREGSEESELSFDLNVEGLPPRRSFTDQAVEDGGEVDAAYSALDDFRSTDSAELSQKSKSQDVKASAIQRPVPPSVPARPRVSWADTVTYVSKQASRGNPNNKGRVALGASKTLPFVIPIKIVIEQAWQRNPEEAKNLGIPTSLGAFNFQNPRGLAPFGQIGMIGPVVSQQAMHQITSREINADGTQRLTIQSIRPAPRFIDAERFKLLIEAAAEEKSMAHTLVPLWPHLRASHQESSGDREVPQLDSGAVVLSSSPAPVIPGSILAAVHPPRAPLILSEAADRLHTYRAAQHRVTFGTADEVHDDHGLCSALPYGRCLSVPGAPAIPEGTAERLKLAGGKRPRLSLGLLVV